MKRVIKVDIGEELYVYLISLEDIIIDRLRATIHWQSEEDGIWGFKLLANNFESADVPYILRSLQSKQEKEEFEEWLKQINIK